MVEHDLRGLSSAQLASVHRMLGEAVRRQIRRGSPIRYAQRIYVPEEHRCLCLFEAAGPDLVRNVNDIAQFPLARVVPVLTWEPDGDQPEADLDEDRPDERCCLPGPPRPARRRVRRSLHPPATPGARKDAPVPQPERTAR